MAVDPVDRRNYRINPLSDEEICEILNESDADLDDFSSESEDEAFEQSKLDITIGQTDSETENDQQPAAVDEVRVNAITGDQRKNLKWITKSMVARGPLHWGEQKEIFEAFLEYFPLEFWKLVSHETYLKSVQDTGSSLKTTEIEILYYVGIEIIMGTLKLPQAKLYWSRLFNFPLICDTMPRDRYFKFINSLHFANNLGDHPNDDKLWKIRPLVDAVYNLT